MKDQLINYIRSGYPALWIVSHEEQRIEAEIHAAARQAIGDGEEDGFKVCDWSITRGVTDRTDPEKAISYPETAEPGAMLDKFLELDPRTVLILRDIHMLFTEPHDPVLIRRLKDAMLVGKATSRVLVIVGCLLKLPPELEKLVTVIEAKLPDRDTLLEVAKGIAKSVGLKLPDNTDAIADAAGGLTTTEAENAFALSIIETKRATGKAEIRPDIVAREKAGTVKKNGIVEIIETNVKLEDVGGLENIKEELIGKRNIFTQAWRDYYGDDFIASILVAGQPGTGKTLLAKCAKSIFGIPLLRLEAGRLFGSLVGQSEANYRSAIGTAKAISPCILWVDEIDGMFKGMESSGQTDGGTTERICKAFLQDMQEVKGVLWFFTCNDIDKLPDPLIDRCDVWSVDLPNRTERESILSIHIAKRKRKPAKFNLKKIAEMLDGFSGRQIEQVWLKAMTCAFNDKKREPNDGDLLEAAGNFTPTSFTMAEQIKRRRERLANRARPASVADTALSVVNGRKLA